MPAPLESHVHLFEPARDGGGGGAPRTLVLLHGTGDDERGFAAFGRLLDPDAALLSVRGNVREGGMNRFFRRLAEGVYDMDDLARRTRGLAAFLEAAFAAYGVERGGAVAVGYSNGANILAALLFERPDLVRRAALLHPLIPFEPPASPGLAGARVLITAGARDPICPPDQSRALHRYFLANGAAGELVMGPGGHGIEPDEVAAVRRWLADLPPAQISARR